jgi:hypothetical protein
MDGRAAWFCAMVAGTPEEGMFRNDLGRALARLHPDDRPFDFLSAAYAELGETAQAASFMALGATTTPQEPDGRKNCEAWYLALSPQDLPEARKKIEPRWPPIEPARVPRHARGGAARAGDSPTPGGGIPRRVARAG